MGDFIWKESGPFLDCPNVGWCMALHVNLSSKKKKKKRKEENPVTHLLLVLLRQYKPGIYEGFELVNLQCLVKR